MSEILCSKCGETVTISTTTKESKYSCPHCGYIGFYFPGAGNQQLKADAGKPKLSLAPIEETWKAIAEVREYGVNKYHSPDNWKRVELTRYYDALFRHIAACVTDPQSVDKESGIRHLKHALCNIAFILELEKEQSQK